MSTATLDSALRVFEEHGYPVIPCGENKAPILKDWTNANPRSYEDIEAIFAGGAALVGVRTGAVSGFFAVDVDPDGAQWLAENFVRLEAKRIHTTRREGCRHLLYKIPDGWRIKNSTSKLTCGVDTRGEGGQVIWWPEHGGRVLEDDAPGLPPAWLLDELARRGIAESLDGAHVNGHILPDDGGDHRQGPGNRNSTLTKLAGSMRRAGFSTAAINDALHKENHQRFDPPLPGAEVNAICTQAEKWEQGKVATQTTPRSPLDWETLEGKTPPDRVWALEHWLPQRHPSLMAGRGGIGKTLAAQHIGTAMVFAHTYIDTIVRPLKVLLWAGEDDEAELWRRQIPICSHFGVRLPDLKDRLILQSYEGCDITLAAPVFGTLAPTPMLEELTEQVRDYHVDYVFLDNIARIYGGNESDRHSVTTFIAWLSAACRPAGLCLLGHPAKGQGSEYSGSTAWEGAVRARLYLSDRLPDAEPAEEDQSPDPGVRYLSRRKSNYSPNDWRRLDYRDGVLVPEDAQPVAAGGAIGGEFARDVVRRAVRKLADLGFHGNASTRSPEYLPKLANQYGLLDRLSEKRFGALMREIIKEGELVVTEVGRYSNRSPKMGLKLK